MCTLPSSSCLFGHSYVVLTEPSKPIGDINEGPFITTSNVSVSPSSEGISDGLHIDGIALSIDNPEIIKMALIKGTTMHPSANYSSGNFNASPVNQQQKLKGGKGPLSQYELSRKARAMGIRVEHIHDGSTIPSERRMLPKEHDLDNISPDATMDISPRKLGIHDGIVKFPTIKHPYETDMPPVMRQREPTNLCELPVCTATITPHLKPLMNTSPRNRKVPARLEQNGDIPPTDGMNSQQLVNSHQNHLNKVDENLNLKTFRFIVSPTSFHDFQKKPERYYSQRFPHVILDGQKDIKKDTLTALPYLTRSKTDLTVIEREINRTAQIMKPIQSVSGWLDGFHCQSKAIHTRPKLGLANVDRTCKTFRWSW